MSVASTSVIVALAPDPALAEQIVRLVRQADAQAEIVTDANALWHALQGWPALALIDLATPGWETPVRWAKNQPHTRAIPVAAFGADLDEERVHLARTAGCVEVWSVVDLPAALPGLLEAVLYPPTRWLPGWDEPPPAALCHGIEQFNAGEYWECHETLEVLWVAERRPIRDLYQGILQVGVALHHLQQQNHVGAIKMFRRGLPRLRGLPEICQGVHVAELAAAARTIHDAVVALGADQLERFNLAERPKVMIAGCPQVIGHSGK